MTNYAVSARGLGHILREDMRHTLCGQEVRKEWTHYLMLRFNYLCRCIHWV